MKLGTGQIFLKPSGSKLAAVLDRRVFCASEQVFALEIIEFCLIL